MERAWNHNPNVEVSPNCPRCGSFNTKFCYYNNYSLTQPRYFCKGCRRYWTKGGSLRNVPVGGGCRKNRRGKSARLSTEGVLSKSLPYNVGQINKANTNFVDSSSSCSSLMQQKDVGSHIDLALVYANFLNPQPESKPAGSFELPELPDVGLSMELRVQLPEENVTDNGLAGTLSFSDLMSAETQTNLRESSDQIYYNVFDSVHKNNHHRQDHELIPSNDQVLPPMPSEEILWLNSQIMMNDHSLQAAAATQEPMMGPEHEAQDPNYNLLFSNWSPLDFSSDDTFSKT